MTFLFVIFCIMLSLMLFPLLLGRYSRGSEGQEPLFIKVDNTKDPRYFAKSFREKLLSARDKQQDDSVLHLSKAEKVFLADGVELSPYSEISEVVLATRAPLDIPAHCVLQKEIYSEKDVRVRARTTIRALAGMENVKLDRGVRVVRWIDAENTLSIFEDCDLGISATAGKRITIEFGCTFQRLYAPEIHSGIEPWDDREMPFEHKADEMPASDRVYDQQRVPANEKIDGSVISIGDLTLEQNCEITQSVHADKNLRICSGSIVRKNVFADGDIVIEDNVIIGGNVFSQKDILIGSHCRVGTLGQTKSIIARNCIALSQDSTFYGYIGSEMPSRIVNQELFFELMSNRY